VKHVCPEDEGRYKAVLRHKGRRQMVGEIMLGWPFASASLGTWGKLIVLP